ncbi:hypothetical protein [Ralstonia mannitolilytica]|uniref:hypothetical protein n=1 Tax=Ralstonia mannitolilytica TaxID=105219 RepID=UPI0009E4786A|nr:hypothetical protein [Ralstonia mannitolilytica]
MIANIAQTYATAAKLLNDNQGVVSVAIFAATLVLGWVSGIFSALRRRPRFKIQWIDGPTFVCTFPTGKKHNEFDVHRTGVALYLKIANTGSAASSIEQISVGYHWHVAPFSRAWFKYGIRRFWLHAQTAAISDFQTEIGENIKVYPFLTQRSIYAVTRAATYLEPGQAENGVVYFEQQDSWGGCYPNSSAKGTRLKVCLRDVFGGKHVARLTVPNVTLEHARKYNPSFGKTLAELRNEPLPHDVRN